MHIPVVSILLDRLKAWRHKENLKSWLAEECYNLRVYDLFADVENFNDALMALHNKYSDLGLTESEINLCITRMMDRNIVISG